MNVTSIKTHKITAQDADITKILDKYLKDISENSVVAVTSKIVAITEGRVVPIEKVSGVSREEDLQKDRLIEEESQYYLPRSSNKYNVSLTITQNMLAASAGIDESNAQGGYVLWPSDPVNSANRIRGYLKKRFDVQNVGVIITDSKTTPLRWGVTAMAIGYSGISPLKDYIGQPDLFGRNFVFEKMNIIDNLASAASVVMGEGAEGTPIAVITDIPFVEFVDYDPTEQELLGQRIELDDDLYAPLLRGVEWKKGKKA